ncbi:MAG: hypothetical protein HY690_16800 [Chloroflexi bacterium]|nr:hypothetical protein [Chloroflexota bacterium]
MIESPVLAIVALGFVGLVGSAVRRLALPGLQTDLGEALALDFGLGAATLTLWMLALAALGLAFSLWSIGVVLVPLGLALLVGGAAPRPRWPTLALPRWRFEPRLGWLVELAPLMVLVVVLGGAAVLALSQPETNWDTLSHWGLKAKAFWIHQTIWLWDYDAHNYYPLLVPLLTTWLYTVLGRVDEPAAKSLALGYGVALLLLFYHALRRGGLGRFAAGAFTLPLLLVANQLVQQLLTNQADLPLTFYLTGALVYAWRWLQQPGESRHLVLASLLAGAAAWTKFEGLFLDALLALALFVTLWLGRRPLRAWLPPVLAFGGAAAGPALAWAAYRASHGIPVEDEHLAALLVPDVVLPVLGAFAHYLLAGRSAALWLAVLGGWLLFARRSLDPRHRFLSLALGLNLVAIVWAFTVDATDPLGQVERTGGRLLMHIAPLGLLLLASLVHDAQVLTARGSTVPSIPGAPIALPAPKTWRGPQHRASAAVAVVLLVVLYSLTRGVAALGSVVSPSAGSGATSESGRAATFDSFVAFVQTQVPSTVAYLYQEPWGAGRAHRLRYELYPRRYEELPSEAPEAEVRAFVRTRGIGYILVLDSSLYATGSWALEARPWFQRVELSPTSFVLKVVEP